MQTIHSNVKDICMVTWSFTNMCNFSCRYCPDDLHSNTSGFPNYDDALFFIKTLAEKNQKIGIELIGGETTLWPKLINFLTEIRNYSDIFIIIQTNGSRTNTWWRRFCEAELHNNVTLNLSYHAAFCDPELFYSNLEIVSKKHSVVSSFMVDPIHFEKVYSLFEKVKSNLPIDCYFKVLREKFHSEQLLSEYDIKTLEFLKSVPEIHYYDRKKFPKESDNIVWPTKIYFNNQLANWQQILINKHHSFKGWQCSAGSKRFFINFDGDVFPCSSFQLPNYRRILGNIKEKNVNILEKYLTCPIDFCPCKFDALAYKFKE